MNKAKLKTCRNKEIKGKKKHQKTIYNESLNAYSSQKHARPVDCGQATTNSAQHAQQTAVFTSVRSNIPFTPRPVPGARQVDIDCLSNPEQDVLAKQKWRKRVSIATGTSCPVGFGLGWLSVGNREEHDGIQSINNNK